MKAKDRANRVEQFIIRRNNPDFKVYSKMGYLANNLFNLTTYYARQWFFSYRGKLISNKHLAKWFKSLNDTKQNTLYSKLNAQVGQQVLRKVHSNFESFFRAIKSWKKSKSRFTGRPKPPHYHKKARPCTFFIDNQDFRVVKNKIIFSKRPTKRTKWWKRQLHAIKLNPNIKVNKVKQITVVPHDFYIQVLVSYKVSLPKHVGDNHRYMSIDPGLNNLVCAGTNVPGLKPFIINGRPLKSINQYANKKIAQTKACLIKCNQQFTSRYLDFLFTKRHLRIEKYMHEASKYVVDYALSHDISRIIIGNGATNSKQKANLGHKNNQNFIQIPFSRLIQMIQYKAENIGIPVKITEESYTSQSSFLDGEMPVKANGNKSRKAHHIKHATRRVKRGLYIASNGERINADLNGALQIMKKVAPNAFQGHGVEDYVTDPVKINMA